MQGKRKQGKSQPSLVMEVSKVNEAANMSSYHVCDSKCIRDTTENLGKETI